MEDILEEACQRLRSYFNKLVKDCERNADELRSAIQRVIDAIPPGLPVRHSVEATSITVHHPVGVPTHTTYYYYIDYDPSYGLSIRHNHSWSGRGDWMIPVESIKRVEALRAIAEKLPDFISELAARAKVALPPVEDFKKNIKEVAARL